MWIKLKKQEEKGSVHFVMPNNTTRLSFNDGDRVKCRLNDGSVEVLVIAHRYLPYEEVDGDGSVNWIEKKSPELGGTRGKLYSLDHVEVDAEDMKRYMK